MDDIYRNFITPTTHSNDSNVPIIDKKKSSSRRQDQGGDNEDYEEGDFTGYVMQQPAMGSQEV